MGMTWQEAEQEAAYSQLQDDIIEEFKAERLGSYFSDNPQAALPGIAALATARTLLPQNATAGFLFAFISAEFCLSRLFLRPLVFGVVHQETSADILSDLIARGTGWQKSFEKIVFPIIQEHCGIELGNECLDGSGKPIWKQFVGLKDFRNSVVHRAETANAEQARCALSIAQTLMEDVFPRLLATLGYRLDSEGNIRSRYWRGFL